MQFANVDMEKCLGELFGMRRLEGSGNLAFAVDSTELDVQELAGNLNGTVQVTASRAR